MTQRTFLMALVMVMAFLSPVTLGVQTTIEASGSIAITGLSSFFNIDYRFFNGLAHFSFSGPNISNITDLGSSGNVAGRFDISENSFAHRNTMLDGGTLSSLNQINQQNLIVFHFNGVGFTQLDINSDRTFGGDTNLFALLDAEYIWLTVKDDRREPEGPILKLVGIGFNGPNVRMTVKNHGDATASGMARIKVGLSYKAWFWLSDSLTRFQLAEFGMVKIKPGKTATFDFQMPASIPQPQIDVFIRSRGLFESPSENGWHYPNPAEDCFHFILTVDGQSVDAFSPTITLALAVP